MRRKTLIVRDNILWIWLPILIPLILMGIIHLTNTNRLLFFELNGLSKYTGDIFWAIATNFGDGLFVSLFLLPFIKKRGDLLWSWFLISIIVTIIIQISKEIFSIPRPAGLISLEDFHLIGRKLSRRAFPSGHAATIFSLAGLLSLSVYAGWKRIMIIICATIVALSRICVGVHWPIDVMGGIVIGWFSSWVGIKISESTSRVYKKTGKIILASILIIISFYVIIMYNTQYGEVVLWLQRILSAILLFFGCLNFVKMLKNDYKKSPG